MKRLEARRSRSRKFLRERQAGATAPDLCLNALRPDGYGLAAATDLRITSSAASRPAQPVTFTHLPGSRSL